MTLIQFGFVGGFKLTKLLFSGPHLQSYIFVAHWLISSILGFRSNFHAPLLRDTLLIKLLCEAWACRRMVFLRFGAFPLVVK